MANDKNNSDTYENVLDPKFLKPRLIYVSLFITSYELLKYAIVDRIRSFYISGFKEGEWIVSPDYKKRLADTGAKGILAQSLAWLKDLQAINDTDVDNFHKIRAYRNKLAHELPDMVHQFNIQMESSLLRDATTLLKKIETWWVKEVEMATDENYAGTDVSDEDIQPGSVIFLQMIYDIALGEGEEAEAYLKEYIKRQKRF